MPLSGLYYRGMTVELFEIARLYVQMDARGELLYSRSRAYLADGVHKADIVLDLPEAFFEEKHAKYPQVTLDECRYIWMGEAFYARLLRFDGMLMHASCVEKDGFAYLFSAKSGTGKSTHTAPFPIVGSSMTTNPRCGALTGGFMPAARRSAANTTSAKIGKYPCARSYF